MIKLAATVGHNKFYFNLKSSVPVILNYGHTSISCKTYVRSLVSQCLHPDRAFGVQTKFAIALVHHLDLDMTSNETMFPFH